MKQVRAAMWQAALALAVSSCGGTGQLGSRYIKSVDVVASQGGLIEITAAESAEHAGTSLLIPPGALQQNTRVTVEAPEESVIGAHEAASATLIWAPSAPHFMQSVTMTLPYRLPQGAQEGDLAIHARSGSERWLIEGSSLQFDSALRQVSFNLDRLATFQAGLAPTCDGGACPRGFDGGGDVRYPDGGSQQLPRPDGGFPISQADGGFQFPRADGGSQLPRPDGGFPISQADGGSQS